MKKEELIAPIGASVMSPEERIAYLCDMSEAYRHRWLGAEEAINGLQSDLAKAEVEHARLVFLVLGAHSIIENAYPDAHEGSVAGDWLIDSGVETEPPVEDVPKAPNE